LSRNLPGRARDFVETSSRYEGEGGYTVVNSERVPMYPGDLVLTPNCSWHDHHVVEGAGYSVVGGQRLDWEDKDVFTVWT
jgi:gentisate 1,2-dioxygenase